MILDKLVLHNFGVFRGEQTLELTPKKGKPIILLGGLNGGGKTTILDALHLALYGKRAKVSNRNGMSYDEYLKRSIHKSRHRESEAAVELWFRRHENGEEVEYQIRRSWVAKGKGVRESLEVVAGDRETLLDDETWAAQVEEILPNGVSHLFLFDGEKIEQLAQVNSAKGVLETALEALLGLGLVGQLDTDLKALERRKLAAMKSPQEREAIEGLQAEIEAQRKVRAGIVATRAASQGDLDSQKKAFRKLEQKFVRKGGDLYENISTIEQEVERARNEVERLEGELRELAHGPLPLMVCWDLLTELDEKVESGRRASVDKAVVGALETRDRQLLDLLQGKTRSAKIIEAVEAFLEQDRRGRTAPEIADDLPSLPIEEADRLHRLVHVQAPALRKQVKEILAALEDAQLRLQTAERKLAAVPDRDLLGDLLTDRNQLKIEIATAEAHVEALDEEISKVNGHLEFKENRLSARLERHVEADFKEEDAWRVTEHAAKARATLAEFRGRIIAKHLGSLEKLVLESFQQLLRKESLVQELHIDPETLTLTLVGPEGEHLPLDRLSAGERQLLAVSLLWGLARGSGHPLPTVIDTPLGRLDSSHRMHLVERYFPYASHQVLLLSTDEEIDDTYYPKLKKWVGRSYQLVHDDKTGTTSVQPGYFYEA